MTLRRVASRRAALLGLGALLVPGSVAAAPAYQPLFRIERSKNANIVQYDAVLTNAETLDPKRPVVAYWILLARDGRREGLSALEKRAYGFTVTPEQGGSWLLRLRAGPPRNIRVVRWSGRWIAQMVIDGKNAALSRMYVSADDSAFIPSVRYVDLHGVELVSGRSVVERVKP